MINFIPSLRYRIAGLTFLLLTITVCSLLYLTNTQMHNLFAAYLNMPQMNMGHNEMSFLHSVHESLIWVGLLFIIIGFAASFLLAKSITKPLQALAHGAEEIQKGKLGVHVDINSSDEIGQLADTFNKMSAQLAQMEEIRRKFLADTAHELRTPLAILNGNLENMLTGVSEPTMERLFSMQEEILRLTRLVENIRDLSLAKLHKLPLHKRPTSINQLLLRAVDMFKPLLDEHKLSVNTEFTNELPDVFVDADRINQVFYNLISNAIRYSPPAGSITLRTSIKKKNKKAWLVTECSDNGNGIADKDLPHIFDSFYRGDAARSRADGGTGIGLSLVKYYSEAHDGFAEAANEPTGGAVFSVWLPIDED